MAPLLRSAAFALASTLTGCVAVPWHVHVPDATQGGLVYEKCSISPNVAMGISVERNGVHAIVSLVDRGSHAYVETRFDVPTGRTLSLAGDVIRVDRRDGAAPEEARIPKVSLIDTPGTNSYRTDAAVQRYLLPVVGTPLVGGRIEIGRLSSDRHFWIAARLAPQRASDVWVTLPPMTIDGVAADLPPLHFQRELIVAVIPFNC